MSLKEVKKIINHQLRLEEEMGYLKNCGHPELYKYVSYWELELKISVNFYF